MWWHRPNLYQQVAKSRSVSFLSGQEALAPQSKTGAGAWTLTMGGCGVLDTLNKFPEPGRDPQTLPRCTLYRSRQICHLGRVGPPVQTDPGFGSSQEGPQPWVPMCQEILLDLISCGDTGKHTPDVGKNFAIKESHCKCHGAGSLTVVNDYWLIVANFYLIVTNCYHTCM